MKDYNTEPLSTFNTDLNAAMDGVASLSGYATTESLTAYASKQYVEDYVDQHASTGDYLPLSGGDLSGRIYLKKTETIVIPGESHCTISFDQSQSFWNDLAEDNLNFTAHYEITVLNAGQEFVDMLANYDDYTGESLGQWNVNVYVRLEDTNGILVNPVEVETSGTVSFGNAYCNGSISIDEYITELEEWEASGEIGNLVFDEGSGGNGPSVHLNFNYNGDQSDFAEDGIGYGSDWTVYSTSETTTVTTTDPFTLSSDLSSYIEENDLSGYATKNELSTKADISAITEITDISACLSSNEFSNVNSLASGSELSIVIAKVNEILNALKRVSSSYVDEGMIAWWDAINNDGTGTHSSDTTTWKDLKGSNDLIYPSSTSGKWSSNYFTFNKTYCFYSTTSTINSQISNGSFTAECVYTITGSRAGNDGLFGSRIGTSGNVPKGIYGNCNGGSQAQCGIGDDDNDMKIQNSPALTAITTIGNVHYLAVVFDVENNEKRIYHNGTLLATKSGAVWPAALTHTGYMIGRAYADGVPSGSSYDRCINANVYGHRIYSRALTADEITSNYLLDKSRYGF